MPDKNIMAELSAQNEAEEPNDIPLAAGAIKRYEMTKPSSVSSKRLEITRDGAPYLWTISKISLLKSNTVSVHSEHEKGPVVSGIKFHALSTKIDVVLGDPDQAGVQTYTELKHDSMWKTASSFDAVNGKRLTFKSTHDKQLGGSKWAADNYKLVDPDEPDKVLMVFIHRRAWGWSRNVGYIDFFVELGEELELQAVTCIVAILYRVTQNRRTAAASPGGSGAAAVVV